MRKLWISILSLGIVVSLSQAQDQKRTRSRTHQQEYVMRQDGKMKHHKGQNQTALKGSMSTNDDTSIDADSTSLPTNHQRKKLRNGECLESGGKKYRSKDRCNKKIEHQEKHMDQRGQSGYGRSKKKSHKTPGSN